MSALKPEVSKFKSLVEKTKSKLSSVKNGAKNVYNGAKSGVNSVIEVGERTPAIKKFVMYFWIFIQIIIILIIIYIGYLIIFGAYPRVLINLMCFSFFNQEPYDVFIKNNILWNSIQILNSANSQSAEIICNHTISGYITGDFINVKLPPSISIYSSASNLTNQVNTVYASKASLASFYAINEYFTFHDLIKESDPHVITYVPGLTIDPFAFYSYLQGYKQRYEGVTLTPAQKKMSPEVLVVQNYANDSNVYYNRILGMWPAFSNLASETSNIGVHSEYSAYLIAPPGDTSGIVKDFPSNWANISTIQDSVIKGSKVSILNSSYSWLLTEICTQNNNYNNLSNMMTPFINPQEYNTLVAYVNASSNMKPKIQKTLFGRNFQQMSISYDSVGSLHAMGAFGTGPNLYPVSTPITSQTFIAYTQVYPLFTFVYFNPEITSPASFYNNMIDLYTRCAGGGPINLSSQDNLNYVLNSLTQNITNIKDYLNASQIVSLYLNVYQPHITEDCSADFVDTSHFFKALFDPYKTDIINNRIKVYMHKTFNRDTWQNSYTQFLVKWEMVGQLIKNAINTIVAQFHTSANVTHPTSSVSDEDKQTSTENSTPAPATSTSQES